jgi:hypothetical protein
MVITDPTTARGIFYKLAQEFEEMDRRNKIPIRQIENTRISKLKFETQQTIMRFQNVNHGDITNDKKMVIPQ